MMQENLNDSLELADGRNEPMTLDEFMADYGFHFANPDSVFVAHNVSFDLRFLGSYLHPDAQKVCTLRLARHCLPDADNHKLQTLKYVLGLESGDAHRAIGDVQTLINLFTSLCALSGLTPLDMIALSATPIPVRRMGFGKHKGELIADLPRDYVRWLLNKADNVDTDLRVTLKKLHPGESN